MALTEISPLEISDNPVKLISRDWMLVTAGSINDFNTMTASWGMIGEMWGQHVVETVVRPQRFTREFIDNNSRFTLSFFPKSMRPLLQAMGTESGREIDKMHFPGLDALELPDGQITFNGARLVIEAELVYRDQFSPDGFLDREILEKWYDNDLHFRYIGRITHVWVDSDSINI